MSPTSSTHKRRDSRSSRLPERRGAGNSPALMTLVPLAFVLGLLAGYLTWGRDQAGIAAAPPKTSVPQQAVPTTPPPAGNTQPTKAPQQSGLAQLGPQLPTATQQIVRYDVPIDDDPILGPENAEITIIEFSDYECPYCRKWHSEVYAKLLQSYPGQIRFVYRDYPLKSLHANAAPAAEAANCANEQGKFWEFHEKLFSSEASLGNDAYVQYAQDLGLDLNAFNQCVSERRYQNEVEADLAYATQLGVRSTPTFFVNGIAVVGAQPFEAFQSLINQELAGVLK